MFKKESSEKELVQSMRTNIMANAMEDKYNFDKLTKEADLVTGLLESLAARKPKAKKKDKKKKSDKYQKSDTENLTSEKMVDNLKNHGTMFDKNDSDDIEHLDVRDHKSDVSKLLDAGLSPQEIKEIFD